jgi:flagellar P-ring protein precursor FlgI
VANGGAGTRQVVNHPTVGRLPAGATIERAAPVADLSNGFRFQLRHPDFTTAVRIADAINKHVAGDLARAENSAVVAVAMQPQAGASAPEFIARLESLTVDSDRLARIVINERTGTIVMGKDVRITPAAVMHGNLTIEVSTAYEVSQPEGFSRGTTEIVPRVNVGVREEKARNLVLREGASVEELVRALGSIGATPRDVIAIIQNLKQAGAIEAEIEVI